MGGLIAPHRQIDQWDHERQRDVPRRVGWGKRNVPIAAPPGGSVERGHVSGALSSPRAERGSGSRPGSR